MLSNGTKLGVYEVISLIGAGGMGEVYRARDTRLNRDVAVKALPEAFARDGERMARFEREARMLASLNHPNIAAIYGLEESGAIRALVMELVEGSTLAERIGSGAIPLEEALPIARQISDALEYAHDHNVIHRDLKPANIKVKADGVVKVLDFGLAKALSNETAEMDMSNSPTLSMAATRQGVILGTAAYMSPEQAKGKAVDRRTDVWAFGAVLYEMLAGKQAFPGEDITEVLASVVKSEPAMDVLPAQTPAAIRTLVRRCLEKNARRRLQSSGEARIIVEDVLSGAAGSEPGEAVSMPAQARPFWRELSAWALAAVLAAVTGVAFWRPWVSAPAAPVVSRFTVTVPQNQALVWGNGGLAISPDGRYVAYSATPSGGTRQLFLRAMDRNEVIPIPGTEEASALFFSPDNQWLGFTASNKLKKVPVAGGTPITLCDRLSFSPGSWTPDGTIYFADTDRQTGKLMRVPAAGGACQSVATFEIKPGEQGPRWLEVLPGGEAILVVNGGTAGAFSDDATIFAQSLKTGERKTLIQGGTSPHYLSTGHLIYAQGGRLLAVPFDVRRLEVTGAAVPILEDVGQGTGGYSAYALSANGSLAYMNGGEGSGGRAKAALQWVDRAGMARPALEDAHALSYPYLSPDGRRVALRNGDVAPGFDMWIADLARSTLTRLTFLKSNDQAAIGVWTPDSQRVIYGLLSTGAAGGSGGNPYKLMWRLADGTGAEEELLSGADAMYPQSCSPDGQFLVYYLLRQGHRDLFLLPLKGERKPRALIENSFNKVGAQISPDGRWIAYVSDESKRQEVFVQPFPDLSGRWQISTAGGAEPRWSRTGRELFYRSGSKMMVVDIESRTGFTAGVPRMLFDQPYSAFSGFSPNYDVAADGQRFLMLKDIEEQTSQLELRMVLNWGEEVRRRMAAVGTN